MTTILLHGFWGQPRDWNLVLEKLPLTTQVLAPDLYESGVLAPSTPLPPWTTHFWHWVDAQVGAGVVQIVGYSMGGRLALNAARARPERVSRLLTLSANPQLPAGEFAARAHWEQQWSEKFRRDDWAALAREWQEQPALSLSPEVTRRSAEALREGLALSLVNWSLRLHDFSEASLMAMPRSWDWAFGALDQKYLEVAKHLQGLPVQGQIAIIPRAGHRLIVEAADFISQWIREAESDHAERVY